MFGVSKGPKPAGQLRRLWQANIADHVIALAWAPTGSRLAVAAVSGPITLFDGESGDVQKQLAGHSFGTTAVAWNADGAHFASAGQDGKVRLWDLHTGETRLALDGGAAWVERLAWCPTANFLASGAGKKLRLWDAQGKQIRTYPDHPSTIADLQWKPKSSTLASAAYGRLALWAPDADEPLKKFEWKGSMLVLAWSPDGKYIATGDQDLTVHFWIVKTGQDLQMSGYPLKVRELSWDSTSRFLATGGGEVPCVWDCSGKGPANTTPIQLKGHQERVSALAFQPSGPLLASGGEDKVVALWHPAKGNKPVGLDGIESAVTQLAWSPDETMFAVGAETGAVVVYAIG